MINPDPLRFRLEDIPPIADRSKLESPLELMFIETLEKYLSGKTDIIPQFEINTAVGKFRMDFVLTFGDTKIGFECDGKEFHNEWRDEWRDAMILGTGEIDTIYRFRGTDLYLNMDDCIYMIYHYDKPFFNNRYERIGQQLISKELQDKLHRDPLFHGELNTIHYPNLSSDGTHIGWRRVVVERRSKSDQRGHWNVLLKFALSNPGLSLDQIIEAREKNWIR